MVRLLKEDRENFPVKLGDLHTMRELGIPDADLAQRPTDADHVLSLILSNPRDWPAILITKTDQGYLIVDGLHRQEAAKDKALEEILATCKTFKGMPELIDACFQANLLHGLPLNEQSRSKYAYWLHKTHPTMTQEEIGKRAHIRQPTVSKAIERWARAELQTAARAAPAAAIPEEEHPTAPDIVLDQEEAYPSAEEQRVRETEEDRIKKELQKTLHRLAQEEGKILQHLTSLDELEQRRYIIELLAPENIQARQILLKFAQLLERVLEDKPRRKH